MKLLDRLSFLPGICKFPANRFRSKDAVSHFGTPHHFCTVNSSYPGVSVARVLRSALGLDEAPDLSRLSPRSPPCEETNPETSAAFLCEDCGDERNRDSQHQQTNSEIEASTKQSTPHTESSQDIIKLLINRANTQMWITLNKEIQERNIEIKPKEIAWVIKVLKNPLRARELFLWAAQKPGYCHDAACYATMIECLGDAPDQGFLNNLLAEMEKNNMQLDVATINRLIGIFASANEIERAEHYFLKLQTLGTKLSAFSYKCMLQAFARAGESAKALDLYSIVQKEKQPVDLVTHNMLLDCLSKNGKAKCAWEIFKEMRCHGPVDVYTYTVIARSYGQEGMFSEALDLLEEMVQDGVEPNRHTYNTILHALVNVEGKLDDAVKIFKRMLGNHLHPDVISCQSMLKILCKGRQVSRISELALSIQNTAVRKDVCENFIRGLSKMGHLQEICALFQMIKASNLQPNLVTCVSMIEALCRGGEPNEALLILREAEEKIGAMPLTAYNGILTALRNHDQFQKADDLFRQMKMKGPLPDVVSYNIIISGLVKVGQLPHAESLFFFFQRSGCAPNGVTFNSLLHCYARKGDVKMVRKLLQMMYVNEVSPDVITYNCTLECFGKAGKPKVAMKVFKEMKEKGVSPSFVTYNHLLLALADAAMTDEALSVFEQMKDQGFLPDALTFAILRRIYKSDPHLDEQQLVEEIHKNGLQFDIKI